jgi:hypothetical protein
MFKAAAALITAILTAMATGCFGPLDPTNPPPARTENSDDTSHTTTSTHAPGLIAWWTCNDSSATTLRDSQGTFNGLISGCTVDSGIEGAGLRLNGTSSYISVAPPSGDSSFDFHDGDFTVSVWVKPEIMMEVNDTSRLDIVARGKAEESGFVLTILQNRFAAIIGPQVRLAQNDDYPADEGTWRHVVLTRSDGNVALYVDNNIAVSFESAYSIDFSQQLALQIGRDNSGKSENYYSGLIDEIKILDLAWDASEVNREYRRFRS